MTYNVFGGTLSITQSINHQESKNQEPLVMPLLMKSGPHEQGYLKLKLKL